MVVLLYRLAPAPRISMLMSSLSAFQNWPFPGNNFASARTVFLVSERLSAYNIEIRGAGNAHCCMSWDCIWKENGRSIVKMLGLFHLRNYFRQLSEMVSFIRIWSQFNGVEHAKQWGISFATANPMSSKYLSMLHWIFESSCERRKMPPSSHGQLGLQQLV